MAKKLTRLQLDWIDYLIGKADKNDLHPENKGSLAAQRILDNAERAQGRIPLKPRAIIVDEEDAE